MLKLSLVLGLAVLCSTGCGDPEPQVDPPPTNELATADPATADPATEVPTTEESPIEEAEPGTGDASPATEGNRLVVEAMRNAGADLSKATEVTWFIYFPAEESARAFAVKATAGGWTTEVELGADEASWLCECTRQALADLESIEKMQAEFEAWSEGLDADIDGWEAAITK